MSVAILSTGVCMGEACVRASIVGLVDSTIVEDGMFGVSGTSISGIVGCRARIEGGIWVSKVYTGDDMGEDCVGSSIVG